MSETTLSPNQAPTATQNVAVNAAATVVANQGPKETPVNATVNQGPKETPAKDTTTTVPGNVTVNQGTKETVPNKEAPATAPNKDGPSPSTDPPPHHVSDVDTWGGPDRNYFVFVVLSILFGFFGLDHMYLRSYGTGFYKLLVNVLALGLWYWWDILQIATEAKKVRTEGLSSPMDWIRGIGRGVFMDDVPKQPVPTSQKSYILYTFLAVMFGWLGADKFYIGEYFQGFVKLISCFNLFLLLFGWVWVAWDAVHAFFMTESILKDGIKAPMPYSFLFSSATPGDIFKVSPPSSGTAEKESCFFCPPDLSSLFSAFSPKTLYKDIAIPLMTPQIVKAIDGIGTVAKCGLPSCDLPSMPSLSSLPSMPSLPSLSSLASTQMPTLPSGPTLSSLPSVQIPSLSTASLQEGLKAVNALANQKNQTTPQAGGARELGGPGPVIAGALAAVVLAGGLKGFYDVLVQQLG